jgi:hypothetical protein
MNPVKIKITAFEPNGKQDLVKMREHASSVHLGAAVKSKGPLMVQTARQGLAHVGGTYKALLLCSTYVCESTRRARNARGVDLASSSRLNFHINLVTADLNMSGKTTVFDTGTTSNKNILPVKIIRVAKCVNADLTAAMGQEHSVTGNQGTPAFHCDSASLLFPCAPHSEEPSLGTPPGGILLRDHKQRTKNHCDHKN